MHLKGSKNYLSLHSTDKIKLIYVLNISIFSHCGHLMSNFQTLHHWHGTKYGVQLNFRNPHMGVEDYFTSNFPHPYNPHALWREVLMWRINAFAAVRREKSFVRSPPHPISRAAAFRERLRTLYILFTLMLWHPSCAWLRFSHSPLASAVFIYYIELLPLDLSAHINTLLFERRRKSSMCNENEMGKSQPTLWTHVFTCTCPEVK